MSDTLTPSGLQSSAGLYGSCGVYQFDRNGAIFNPLDLNPYLLFDAESSMIGTLENPTLDLDPTKQESLDVITATRAGTATFVNLDGEIEIAQPNTVRVDNSLGYPAILIEPSATSLLPYSEDFESGNWEKVAVGTGSNPIVTPDYALSPDGTQNASRVQFDKGSGNASADLSILRYNISITNGLTVNKSVYLKSKTSDAYDLVLHDSSDGSGTNVKKITVTPEWQRFDVYGTAPGTSTGISFGLRNINVTGVSNTADVLVWGAQLEAGSVSTSYIPTSGSTVTRAADDLVISGSDFDFYNQSEGTIYVESVPNDNTSESFLFDLSFGDASTDRLNIFNVSGNQYVFLKTAGTTWTNNVIGSRPASGVFSRVAISYKTNDVRASLDGVNMATDTSATISSTLNKMTIGNRYQNPNYLNGRIRRLIFWPYSSDSL